MTAVDASQSPEPKPLGKLTPQEIMVKQLDRIYAALTANQGRAKNIEVREYDIATTDPALVVTSDFDPDHWMIWLRYLATATLRIGFGGSVSALPHAYEIRNGQGIKLGNPPGNRSIALFNSGSVTAHVFVAVVGGGLELDLFSTPQGT